MSVATLSTLRSRPLDRFNIAPGGRRFRCKFMEPGVVAYHDIKCGVELLRKETLERAMPTTIGNPVTIGHIVATPENRANIAHGTIDSWEYNAEDGWFYVMGDAHTDRAVELMQVQQPSSGYQVTEFGPGGTHHGVKYEAEITDLVFNHLAIVPKGRYEEADFRLNSSVSNQNNMNLLRLFKKVVTRENGADGKPADVTKTEAHQVDGNTEIEVEGVGRVRLNQLTEAMPAPQLDKVGMDTEFEVHGKQVPLSELIANYKATRQNAAPAPAAAPAATPAEPVKADAGRESFVTLHTARHNAAPAPVNLYPASSGSLADRAAVGARKY